MQTDDLCKLLDTTDENLVKVLQERYLTNRIYTNAGLVLISINPYINLDLYGKNVMNAYFNSNSCDPHIYSLCEIAYLDLKNQDQTIMISGESGSGKTENTKYLQEYLITRTNSFNFKNEIDALTIILESFGNAKTVLNDNSSRVGKMVSYFINENIEGVKLTTFLLEKSRVTHQNQGENNFNIFYQLCKYKNISINNDYINTNDEVKGSYKEIKKAFNILGFGDIDFIENILLSILYLGNSINDNIELDFICKTLNIEKSFFKNILEKKEIKVNNETLIKLNTPQETLIIRDSISRILYTKLFDFIVNKINNKLNKKEGSCINVLDIFGFEIFKENSLDQLCINYCNEKIQMDFVKKIFEEKQNEYLQELKDYKFIPYNSNCNLIYELEKRCGLFDLIDEESKNKFGSLDNLRTKISTYIKKGIKVKSNDKIVIKHFIKDVEYEIRDFIIKNRQVKVDPRLFSSIQNVTNNGNQNVTNNGNQNVTNIGNQNVNNVGNQNVTVIGSFLSSLNSLFRVINNTQIKYIRCIKPNEFKTNTFDKNVIYNQLISTGILEVIKISKQIFTYEMDLEEWREKYYKFKGVLEGKTKVYFNTEIKVAIEASEKLRSDRRRKVFEWFMNKLILKKEGMNNIGIDKNVKNIGIDNNVEIKSVKNVGIENNVEIDNNVDDKVCDIHEIENNDNVDNIEMCEIKEGIFFKDQEVRGINSMEDMISDLFTDQEEVPLFIPPPNKTKKDNTKKDKKEDNTKNNKKEEVINNFLVNPPCTEKDISLIFGSDNEEDIVNIEREKTLQEINDLINESKEEENESKEEILIEKSDILIEKSDILIEKSDILIEQSEMLIEKSDILIEDIKNEEILIEDIKNEEILIEQSEMLVEDIKNEDTLLVDKNIFDSEIKDLIPSPISTTESSNIHTKDCLNTNDCSNCKNLELKYKFVSEALKEANQKLASLSSNLDSPSIIENASSLFSRLFHLYLENIPHSENIPKSEMLSFAHSAFLITKRSNKDLRESACIFTEEISLRLKYFEKNINHVLFFLSNLIEYSKLLNTKNCRDLDSLINNLFIYLSEYYLNILREYIPFSVTDHQELPNFKCSDSFIKKIFKPVSITRLIKTLHSINDQMEYYYLDKDYKISIINNILSNINTGVFNNLLVKKNFLSFNRCIQINYNINQIYNFLNIIGYPEGRENLKHVMEVIKLVNINEKEEIQKNCKILTGGQIKAFLMKISGNYYDQGDYHKKDNEKIFITSNPLEIIKKVKETEENFVVPRFITSEELGFVYK